MRQTVTQGASFSSSSSNPAARSDGVLARPRRYAKGPKIVATESSGIYAGADAPLRSDRYLRPIASPQHFQIIT
jgi:hypothetical protein